MRVVISALCVLVCVVSAEAQQRPPRPSDIVNKVQRDNAEAIARHQAESAKALAAMPPEQRRLVQTQKLLTTIQTAINQLATARTPNQQRDALVLFQRCQVELTRLQTEVAEEQRKAGNP